MFVVTSTFDLGDVVVTQGINAKYIGSRGQIIHDMLQRHCNRDDGDLCSEDKQVNIDAHESGGRIFSLYKHDGDTIYIITESDRRTTTILFDYEY